LDIKIFNNKLDIKILDIKIFNNKLDIKNYWTYRKKIKNLDIKFYNKNNDIQIIIDSIYEYFFNKLFKRFTYCFRDLKRYNKSR